MIHRIIIDADPGIGDALAVVVALLDPEIELLAVTATAGCVSGHQATQNLQAIIAELDPDRRPRIGASHALATDTISATSGRTPVPTDLHGKTGLGDCRTEVAELHQRRESPKILNEIVRDYPNEVTLITLGPLTNIAVASERNPDFLGLLRGLVCLGGSLECRGDITAAAEFNMFSNPEAARLVLKSPATKTLVPIDIARQVILTFDQYQNLSAHTQPATRKFLAEILPFALRTCHQHFGQEGFYLYELVALCAVTRSHFLQTSSMALDVETRGGITKGMTVFDRRNIPAWQDNIDVVTSVDAQGVLEYLNSILMK